MINSYFRYVAIAIAIAIATVVGFFPANVAGNESAMPAGKPQTGLPTIVLKAGGQSVRADIASTEGTRQTGLMYRQKMGKHEGMLFVFPEIGYHAMWMRNTLIPLSVAYLNERGLILSIHEMQALSDAAHQSAGPARFALEMNAGWFNANKVNAGDTIAGLEKAPKPQ